MTRLPAERLAELAGIWSPAAGGAYCPECGALAPRTSTRAWEDGRRVRYHRCPSGHTFKSTEVDPVQVTMMDQTV